MFHTAWEWDYTNPCLPRSQAMSHTAWEWDYTNPCLPLGDLTIDTRSNMTLPRGTFDLSSKNNRISTNIKKWQKLAPVITHTTQSNLQGMLVLESDPHNIEDGGLVNRLQVKVYTAPNAGTHSFARMPSFYTVTFCLVRKVINTTAEGYNAFASVLLSRSIQQWQLKKTYKNS